MKPTHWKTKNRGNLTLRKAPVGHTPLKGRECDEVRVEEPRLERRGFFDL